MNDAAWDALFRAPWVQRSQIDSEDHMSAGYRDFLTGPRLCVSEKFYPASWRTSFISLVPLPRVCWINETRGADRAEVNVLFYSSYKQKQRKNLDSKLQHRMCAIPMKLVIKLRRRQKQTWNIKLVFLNRRLFSLCYLWGIFLYYSRAINFIRMSWNRCETFSILNLGASLWPPQDHQRTDGIFTCSCSIS